MGVRKLPIGIQSFEDLRRSGYLYVDKTRYIWDLVETGKSYFLSRPRRFGKSLLLTTMQAYFQGKRELFDGLAIQELEDGRGDAAWQEYPVVKFSLAGGEFQSEDGLANTLGALLDESESAYGIDPGNLDLPSRFRNLLRGLHALTGRQAVVLVDEYDKPLLETMIVNGPQEERNRQLYKAFFGVLKDEDEHLRFVFFTGVSKFSKVSIFSDLNQLEDVTLESKAAGICGITEDELVACFRPEIDAMAERLGMDEGACLRELKRMYDGYHFAAGSPGAYNPLSLLNALKHKDLSSYWFSTGTPTFLVNKLMASSFTPEDLVDGVEAEESAIMDYRADDPDPIPLFYQTGYLTIASFDSEFRIYGLKFPNDEVKYGFLKSLVPAVLGERDAERATSARSMVLALRKGDVDAFMERIQALFAGIPYPESGEPVYEREWRNQVYLVLALLGQNVRCEVHSAKGRCDCIVETRGFVYVFEFKLDAGVDEALGQIEEKGYAKPYSGDAREVLKVGVSFSAEERNVVAWKAER